MKLKELSKKNDYHLEKHRFLELQHFCRQYPIWKKAREGLDGLSKRPESLALAKTNEHGSPTERCAEAMMYYDARIEMVERAAMMTDLQMYAYILKGVTEGLSFDILRAQTNMPCSRDEYYSLVRKFFWLLNDIRQ